MSQTELVSEHRDQIERFLELIDRTDKQRPAKKDIQALRDFLKELPELWAYVGDLAEQAAIKIIDSTHGTAALTVSLRAGYVQMQKNLGTENATALDNLLIQQVAICWMRQYIVEYKYTSVTESSATYKNIDYWERRLNATQRRYLRACETLARIRKMNLPTVQVNIAEQQVNVAG